MARRKKTKVEAVADQRSLESPSVPLWSPTAYNYLGAPRSSAGVAVDRHTVLGYPAVWRCISLISGKIARLPLSVYRHNADGGREIDLEHPAQWLLSRRPSPLYTPKTFKQTIVAHALLHGNGYAWIIRDTLGRPAQLILLDPESTGVAMKDGQLYYFLRIGTEARKLLPENVLHIKGLSHDGLIGISVIDALRESFGLGLAASRYGSVFFRNNGTPGPMILKFPGRLDKEQREYLRQEWDKLHIGLDNAHRYAVLANGGDFTQFQINNDTAQFLQTREHEVACGIASIFGVPASKLGIARNDGYNSLESSERAFLNDTLDSWLVDFEEECESKLLKESQLVRDSHFVEFDRRSLQQTDSKTRADILVSEVNNGLKTANEARAELNMPSAGPDGDRYRMPSTVVFQDIAGVPPVADTALDPNEPAEQTVGEQEQEKEPVDTSPVADSESPARAALQQLLTADVRRLLVRVGKAVAAGKPDLEQHRQVWLDALPLAGADLVVDRVFAELAAVLPEQRASVVERLDAAKIAGELING